MVKDCFYHASQISGIECLEPRVSNHNLPLVYFSVKRENVLVYLSNAVEKYCRETGYVHTGKYSKWGSYGFTRDGILRLEEYYPNAAIETYQGVSGYIYSVDTIADAKRLDEIPFAYTVNHEVAVTGCEYIPDAYEAIMQAIAEEKIVLEKYEDTTPEKKKWIEKTMIQEYQNSEATEEYRYFLKGKFPFVGEGNDKSAGMSYNISVGIS